jgi:hypothetical protein
VGINGDYTVKSSDDLYTNMAMQEKLLHAYTENHWVKDLIFNNELLSYTFMKHLEKRVILFVILTIPVVQRNVKIFYSGLRKHRMHFDFGILTTGFDEPTVDTIILNRATKMLTLYIK